MATIGGDKLRKWWVSVEKLNGKCVMKTTMARNIDEACDNVRQEIPVSWRIVTADDYPPPR